jgi:hypothetical protein
VPDGNWRRGEPATGELTARTSPGCYRRPRKPSRMRSSRDADVRLSVPDFPFASASLQSTQPLFRISQVLLSMVRSRQRSPVGETTSKEPVLRSASLADDRGAVTVTRVRLATMVAPTQTTMPNPQARMARLNSPANRRAADGFSGWIASLARMSLGFAAAWGECRSPRLPRDGVGKSLRNR